MKRSKKAKVNPVTNRWGHTFKKGDLVEDHRGWRGPYLRLKKPNDFSRAYGPQALVGVSEDTAWSVGLDDLRPAKAKNPTKAKQRWILRLRRADGSIQAFKGPYATREAAAKEGQRMANRLGRPVSVEPLK